VSLELTTKTIRDMHRDGLDRATIESVIFSDPRLRDCGWHAAAIVFDGVTPVVTPDTMEPAVAAATPPTLTFFESIALPLAERGWKVAPCYPHDWVDVSGKTLGKTVNGSLVPNPLTARSNNPAQIHEWGLKEPNGNVCVYAVQEEGGLCFVDKDGKESLVAKYESETGRKFPETLLVCSSRLDDRVKGHWYFLQTPKTMAAKNISESKTGGLFSFRVKNEYVASIGSTHPVTGQPYTIAQDREVIPMPDELLDWLLAQVKDEPKTREEAVQRGKYTKGTRYPALMSELGRLWNSGYDRAGMVAAGLAWARVHFDTGAEKFNEALVQGEIEHYVDVYGDGEDKRLAMTQGSATESGEKVAKTGMVLSPQVSPTTPTPAVPLVDDVIPDFDLSVITGVYKEIVDAACDGTTIPRQYAFLAAKVYIGALIAGKVSFEGMEDTSSYYGVVVGESGTGKGLSWKRVVDDILTTGRDLIPSVKILEGSGDSGAGLKDFFFDSPKDAPVICMIDEAVALGHKAGEKKNPEIIDTIVELATKHKFTRAKAARSNKAKAGRSHDNAHLSLYMCAQNRDVIAAAFPNRRGLGLFERFYPEFSAPVVAGRLPKVDRARSIQIWDRVQKLQKSGEIKMAPGVEERIDSYWGGLSNEVQSRVRLKAHLTRDMFMAAHGRGSQVAEMEDLEAALKNFSRQLILRDRFFTTEISDRVGLYISRLKTITEGMRRRLRAGESMNQVAMSLRDFQTDTLAYKDNELHVFQTAWRNWSAQMATTQVKGKNGQTYEKFVAEPDEGEMWT
jgi:hypothetical protein